MSGIVGQNLGRASGLIKSGGVGADAVGLAEMASGTDGNIISYDGSGNPTAVATGNDGQVLTSAGAGAICAFEDAAGGGITEIDQWRLTSSLTAGSSETAITANLERVDAPKTHTGNLGTGMSESSGVFTFPSTGWWEVTFNAKFDLQSGGDDRNITMRINATDNNSSYTYIGYQSAGIHNETANTSHAQMHHSVVLDIESTTNDKVKFAITSINGAATAHGQTGYSRTYMKFIKLADT